MFWISFRSKNRIDFSITCLVQRLGIFLLKKKTIEKGKLFAKQRNTSLSRLVENYLDKITLENDGTENTPLVKSLSGVIRNAKGTKADYAEFLRKKYQ